MKKQILLAILALTYMAGCSSSEKIQKENNTESAVIDTAAMKNKALDHFIDGGIAEMKGDYKRAVDEYEKAYSMDPTPGVNFVLGKNYYRLGNLSSALNHSKEAVTAEPENTEYRMLLANVYRAAHKPDSAIVQLEKIVKTDSSDLEATYMLASLYKADKPTKALEIYNRILEKKGPDWNVLVSIAEINEKLGNVDKTIETVEKLKELNPADLDLQKLLIESYLKNDQPEKALELSKDNERVFPEDPSLIEYNAKALIQMNEWDKSAEEFEKIAGMDTIPLETRLRVIGMFIAKAMQDSSLVDEANKIITEVEQDTTHWQLNAYKAELALKKDDEETAVENFKIAAHEAKWNSRLWVRLGGILFDSGKYTEAAEEMYKAVENFPDNFAVNLLLGLSLGQENQHTEAEPYLEKAVKLNSRDFTALYSYGFTLSRIGNNDKAARVIKEALEIKPDSQELWGTLGMIYDNMENWEACDSAYEKALSLDSTDALLLNNYAYSLAERGIQLERAEDMVKKALDEEPGNSSYLDTMGWVYFQLGDYEKAKDFVLKAIDAGEPSAEVLDHLGDIEYKLGNTSEAIENWKKAAEFEPENEKIRNKIEKGGL